MDKLCKIGLGVLVIYSLALLGLEAATSQWVVRNFFADISGPYPFFGINTTVCAFLLWSCALLYVLCLTALPASRTSRRERQFFWSQACVFLYLGLDDRFLLHENLHSHLGIHDGVQFAVLAVLEAFFLVVLGKAQHMDRTRQCLLGCAAASFGLMLAIDLFCPLDLFLRLSMEDLSKAWSAAFLFLFAWTTCCAKIREHQDQVDRSA